MTDSKDETPHDSAPGRYRRYQWGEPLEPRDHSGHADVLLHPAAIAEECRIRRWAKARLLDEIDRRWRTGECLIILADGPVARFAKWCQARPGVAITLAVTLTLSQVSVGYVFGFVAHASMCLTN